MAPASITAAIITLDEEENLPGLLARLGWVNEVVLVDGGSRDATVQIAQAHGARVHVRPFDTFAQQRNFAIGHARGDWVLSIDADERPTEAFVEEVRRRMSDTQAAFRVPIKSSIFGRRFRYGGTQDDRPIRLFRRELAGWRGDVHEVLHVRGRVGLMRNWLEHDTTPDLSIFLGKMDRYTTLAAQARVAAGRRPRQRDRWVAPLREVFRRMVWKKGFFDGPEGWAFCLLSGLSEWVLAEKHERLWAGEQVRRAACGVRNGGASPPRPARQLRRSHSGLDASISALRTPHSALSS